MANEKKSQDTKEPLVFVEMPILGSSLLGMD
jgi:hypothetical protein